MAKPTAGSSVQRTSIHSGTPDHLRHPLHHRPKRRTRRITASNFLVPSPGLLTILASIAASTVTVGCSPTPPRFLCPFASAEDPPVHVQEPRDVEELDIHLSPTPTKRRRGRRKVPDRYHMDDDGRWRRMESYTLYGSTVCLNCQEPTITASSSISDSSADPPTLNPGDMPVIDLDTLPIGWRTPTFRGARTTLILALSLVLAFLICFFIIGCLFWRKTKQKKYRENDVEMRALRRRRTESRNGDSDGAAEGQPAEGRANQKIWSRATARWKANARYTARQRRGRRSIIPRSTITPASTVSFQEQLDEQQPGSVPNSASTSRAPSRRSSIISVIPSSSTHTSTVSRPEVRVEEVGTTSASTIPAVAVSPPSPIHASPPAYHPQLDDSPTSLRSEVLNSSYVIHRKDSSRTSIPSREPSMAGQEDDSGLSPSTDGGLEYAQSLHAAHVATDDKSLLARLGELASSPPEDTNGGPPVGTSGVVVSAPEWRDEELDDFQPAADGLGSPSDCRTGEYLCPTSAASGDAGSPLSPTFPFPPPPSKGKMADLSYYEYSYSYEDLDQIEPELEPSAPPFEESISQPSAPPLSDTFAEPSAPPLDGDFPEDVGTSSLLASAPQEASAPPLPEPENGPGEGESSSIDLSLEYVDAPPISPSDTDSVDVSTLSEVDRDGGATPVQAVVVPSIASDINTVTDSEDGTPPTVHTSTSSSPERLAHGSSSASQTLGSGLGDDSIPPRYRP
ncbi:hypothetical protein HGRIS_008385 [Hohenbuehelia grisea]|uniref:Uncharacterized protein n=1 Tax=Hohenbuehelia grisea TaxID=104357 RepID=A0ABR3J7S6_9AGAR